MKNPQQDIFSAFLVALRAEFGADRVFDGFLPPDGTPYPFVYLGTSQQIDDYGNKMQILGSVRQTVDVYTDDPKKRGTFSDWMVRAIETAHRTTESNSYRWAVIETDQQVIPDNTTNTPLMHGVIDITFQLLGGK
jgi:hypothetical protein